MSMGVSFKLIVKKMILKTFYAKIKGSIKVGVDFRGFFPVILVSINHLTPTISLDTENLKCDDRKMSNINLIKLKGLSKIIQG
uniref:BPI2 domain-containing protein n=1 Tax=Strongyloides venezuelensis TaxID=75913 RepID=A0A0K0FP39_STRVS